MLNVMSENRGNAIIFRCSGGIVAGQEAWTLYNNVISTHGKRLVVLDLTAVSRIDAGGLGVLVSLKQWASAAGIRLQLMPSQAVQELLDLTGLGPQFEIRPEAVKELMPNDEAGHHSRAPEISA